MATRTRTRMGLELMTREPSRQSTSDLADLNISAAGLSKSAASDFILPWMAGFEKRYHPQEYEYDVVICVCGFSCPDSEETREMVQCDQCMNWQHLDCITIRKEDLPTDYFCHLCLPERHSLVLKKYSSRGGTPKSKTPKRAKLFTDVIPKHRDLSSTRALSRQRQTYGTSTGGSVRSFEDVELDDDLNIMKSNSMSESVSAPRSEQTLPHDSAQSHSKEAKPRTKQNPPIHVQAKQSSKGLSENKTTDQGTITKIRFRVRKPSRDSAKKPVPYEDKPIALSGAL